ncbi:MAG: hypothetical protein MI919_33455 [Holophagales bacterium]|nr:hypothetical protein [Holophagales bacterium]
MSAGRPSSPPSSRSGHPLPSAWSCLVRAVRRSAARPLAAVALVSWGVLLAAGCLLPRVGFLFVLGVLPAGFGGLWRLALAIEGAATPDPKSLASVWRHLQVGFARYERFLSLFWIGYLVTIASCGPLFLALWLDRHLTPEWARLGLFSGAGSLSLAILALALHPYLFAFFVAAELPRGSRVQQVLDTARSLVTGRVRGILPRSAGIVAVGLSGSAALVSGISAPGWRLAGLAITLPMALVALAHLYREACSGAPASPTTRIPIRERPVDAVEEAISSENIDS